MNLFISEVHFGALVDYEINFRVKTDLLEKFFFIAHVKEQVKFSREKKFFWNFEIPKIFKKFFSEINSQILRQRGILRRWSKLDLGRLKMIARKSTFG